MSASGRKIVLAKPVDWDTWFSFVKTRASSNEIWNLVNPDLPIRPISLEAPVKPEFHIPTIPENFNQVQFEMYKARTHVYKIDLAEFERQKRSFSDLISYIQDTITVQNAVYIQKEEPHPWNLLRALKQRLAPSDAARCIEIETKYHMLCRGPGDQDLEASLEDWQTTYTEAKAFGIGEVTGTGNRPLRDFLMAIHSREPSFTDNHLIALDQKKETDFHDLIEACRRFVRLHLTQITSKHPTHTAFATDGPAKKNPTYNDRPQPSECYCGDCHWWALCEYLNPSKRPANWVGDPAIQAKVNDAMRDEKTREKVQRAIQKDRDIEQGRLQKSSGNTQPEEPQQRIEEFGAFAAVRTASVKKGYILENSWIIDNGSNTHLCNSAMKSRFRHERDGTGEKLLAGNSYLPIECYGSIVITVKTPTGTATMTLTNVAYVPDFWTNVVSQHLLKVKGLYFDNWKMHLHREGKTAAWVKEFNGHYLLEDNRSAACAAQKLEGTKKDSNPPPKKKVASSLHLKAAAEGVDPNPAAPIQSISPIQSIRPIQPVAPIQSVESTSTQLEEINPTIQQKQIPTPTATATSPASSKTFQPVRIKNTAKGKKIIGQSPNKADISPKGVEKHGQDEKRCNARGPNWGHSDARNSNFNYYAPLTLITSKLPTNCVKSIDTG